MAPMAARGLSARRCALVGLALLLRVADAAPILESLLAELQAEAHSNQQVAGLTATWCHGALRQRSTMVDTLQHQIDDIATLDQEIQSDEKRLRSELDLARSTQSHQEQQLKGLITSARQTMTTLSSAQQQLGAALRSVRASAQAAEVSAGLTSDVGRATTAPQHDTLASLEDHFGQDRDAAAEDQRAVEQKLWLVSDHLNSSAMELASQTAAIGMEMAQHQRERTHWSLKTAALASVLQGAKASQAVIGAACVTAEQQGKQLAEQLGTQARAVQATMRQLGKVTIAASEVISATAPLFLQVRVDQTQKGKQDAVGHVLRDLESLSSEFPEEASWYKAAEHHLAPSAGAKTTRNADEQAHEQVAQKAPHGASPIQSIEHFLHTTADESRVASDMLRLPGEEALLLKTVGELDAVKATYHELLDKVHSKEAAVDAQARWCKSIVRDAQMDRDAVGRELKRTTARLELVRVAMGELQNSSTFNLEQDKKVRSQLAALSEIMAGDEAEHTRAQAALQQSAKQLMSLISELSQNDPTQAGLVRELLQHIERHQLSLQQSDSEARKAHDTITRTDQGLREVLMTTSQRNGRRIKWLKAEAQDLISLMHAKKEDTVLSEQYQELATKLCSADRSQQLATSKESLHREVAELQHTVASFSTIG